jgi:hypothetical protein
MALTRLEDEGAGDIYIPAIACRLDTLRGADERADHERRGLADAVERAELDPHACYMLRRRGCRQPTGREKTKRGTSSWMTELGRGAGSREARTTAASLRSWTGERGEAKSPNAEDARENGGGCQKSDSLGRFHRDGVT